MAYISTSLSEAFDPASTSITLSALPTHQTGDLLIIGVINDVGTIATSTPTSGWAVIGTQAGFASIRHTVWWKIATSNNETPPTFNGSSGTWCAQTLVIKDFDPVTPFNLNQRTDHAAAFNFTIPSVNTTTNRTLVLYTFGARGTNKPLIYPDNATAQERISAGGVTQMICFRTQRTAGATPTIPTILDTNVRPAQSWVIAINNSVNGSLQPTARPVFSVIRPYGGYNDASFNPSWSAGNSVPGLTAINGINMSSTLPTFTATTPISTDWGSSSTVTIADVAAVWGGAFDTFPTVDCTNRALHFVFTWGASLGATRVAAQGLIVVFTDTSNNWVAHQLNTQRESVGGARLFTTIQPGAGFIYAQSASPINRAQINRIGYFVHRTAATTNSVAIHTRYLGLTNPGILVRDGGTNQPNNVTQLMKNLDSWDMGLSNLQGSRQFLNKQSLSFGNNSDLTNVDLSSQAFEIPQPSRLFNVAANSADITINASDNDVMNFSSCLIATSAAQAFTIASTSSTLAQYNFTGLGLLGFNATWKTGIPMSGINFSNGGEIDAQATSILNCSITNGTATNQMKIDSGASLSNVRFTKGASNSYAIRIPSAGDYNFSGVTFSGSYTKHLNVTATTGTVTINLGSVSDTIPTFDTAGATVVINNPTVNINVSGLVSGSRIQLYNVTQNTEIVNTVVGSTTYSLVITTQANNNDVIRLRVAFLGRLPFTTSGIFSNVGGISFLAAQSVDSIYVANGYDGSTVTGLSADYANIQIDANEVDGLISPQEIYAWASFNQTSADGIRNFFGLITAVNNVNYAINTAVAPVKLQNTIATPLKIKGANIYRDDEADLIAADSQSIQVMLQIAYGIETGTSGLTPAEAATLSKLDTLTENVSGLRFTAKALEQAPAGGGGTSDWTATERSQIRRRLGIDGTTAVPTAIPDLAVQIDVAAIKAKTDQLVFTSGNVNANAQVVSDKTGYSLTSGERTAIGTQVRTELATELGRIDVATSTRLASASYTAPDNAGISSLNTKLTTTRAANLDNLDATVSSRLATSGYTTPPTSAQNASAVRTELSIELGRIDATISSRNAIAPDNTSIAAIKAKTDALPVDPADNSDILNAIAAIPTAPSATTVAAAVRTNLTTELARIDANVSSRLATSGYIAPDNTAIADIKAKTDNLPLDPADNSDILAAISAIPAAPTPTDVASAVRTNLTTELGRIDANVSSRLATSGYTAPDNTSIAAIKAKTDNLPASPAATSDIPSASTVATAVRTNLTTELSRIDVNTSSRLAAASYVAPANADVAAIKAKTDNLPADPASQTSVDAIQDDVTETKNLAKLIPATV